jgi:DNA invertase Pin-like site-specific DNA recombinase
LSIDRLGRDLLDILATIKVFNEQKVPIYFVSQGLVTLDEETKEESPIARLVIQILGSVAEMHRNQIREAQAQGIAVAKKNKIYKGRKRGSTEDMLRFLSKPKNKEALSYLKKGYTHKDVATLTGVHINTVTKIKKIGLPN